MKHASVEEQWSSLAKQIAKESIEGVLEGLSRNILIGSVDNQKFGEGFEIIIAGLGFGWWKTREEACDVANIISKAIEQYSDYYKDIIEVTCKIIDFEKFKSFENKRYPDAQINNINTIVIRFVFNEYYEKDFSYSGLEIISEKFLYDT